MPIIRDLVETTLKALTRLGPLPAGAESALSSALSVIELIPGQCLTLKGLCVLDTGLLEKRDAGGCHIAWYQRGQVVGSAEVLSGTCSQLCAHRHSLLLQIDAAFCRQYLLAEGAFCAALAVDALSSKGHDQPRPGPLVLHLSVIGEHAEYPAVAAAFAEACRIRGETALITPTQIAEVTAAVPGVMAKWLEERCRDNRLLVLFGRNDDPDWLQFAEPLASHTVLMLIGEPHPSVITRVHKALAETPTAQLVVLTLHAGPAAQRAWQSQLPELKLFDNSGLDVREIIAGLDLTFEEIGDLNWLRQFSLLKDLEPASLSQLQQAIKWQAVAAGERLFSEGSDTDDVFLLQRGRLQLSRGQGVARELLAEVLPGESIEPSACLLRGPRRFGAHALRDSYVGRIDGVHFRRFVERFPALSASVAKEVAQREEAITAPYPKRPPCTIALLPLDGADPDFRNQLSAALCNQVSGAGVLAPEVIDAHLNLPVAQTRYDGARAGLLERFVARFETDHSLVIYLGEPGDSPWNQRCLRQADRVLLFADANTAPTLRPIESTLYGIDSQRGRVHLALLQRPGISEARHTERWLESRRGAVHHHVRWGVANDCQRLARLLLQQAVGIAFSGASSRGVAHLGVTRALLDCGCAPDVTAGSSSGAAIAALTAMGLDHEEKMMHCQRALAGIGVRLGRLQPPLLSLMSGRAFERHLRQTFGDSRLEDQFTACTLTAVDLNRHRLVHLRSGPIWLAVRASMSLPLFWPPVWWRDRLLVDGGIMSYMPVEVLLEDCAQGLAVASDLDLNAGEDVEAFADCEQYGATLSGWRLATRSLFPRKRPGRRYPGIAEVLFHAMCIPSFQHQQRLRELERSATVRFVRPPIRADGFFSVDEETARRFEQQAYECATQALSSVVAED